MHCINLCRGFRLQLAKYEDDELEDEGSEEESADLPKVVYCRNSQFSSKDASCY